MHEKIQKLTHLAQKRMKHSSDPVHDIHHVRRVVTHVQTLSKECGLNQKQTDALILAAWWHDVSRTITRRPSIVLMPFVDDLISALMLWYATIRCGLFGSIAGMATRMIFCKSFGAGRVLTRVLMLRKNRIMVDILQDADVLDLLHTERNQRLHELAESSFLYKHGYKLAIWWFLKAERISVKTEQAKKYLLKIVEEFIAWIERKEVFLWHVAHYGKEWTLRMMEQGRQLARHIRYATLAA